MTTTKDTDPRTLRKQVERRYREASELAERYVTQEARKLMRQHSSLAEFILAMGQWFFVTKDGQNVDDDNLAYLKPLGKFIDEWDEYLKLTGTGIRFTAEGPIVTDW